eukprot:GILI01014149.1.p1 GENE.GILI01014149.1~~GILI01014149.1.p1  ORF type:complete len:651 (+),score=153.37 GILI01014149.1:74-1954(+)
MLAALRSEPVVTKEDETAATAEKAPLAEDRLDDWSRTVLRLMAEVLRGDSPWRSWLQCCPRMPDSMFTVPLPTTKRSNAVATSVSDQQKLQQEVLFSLPKYLADGESHIVTGPAQQLVDLNIEEKWLLAKPLLDANPNIWPSVLPAHCNALPLSAAAQQAAARAAAAGAFTTPVLPRLNSLKDLFYECAAQVTSRNFHRESQDRPGPYLLPTIDFLNHSSERQNVEFAIHGGGGGKRHVTFDVIATRDILPKEQIFHDYGSLNASRFLVEFQFVLHPRALAADEGLRWSKEALSTLVSLLYCAGNKERLSSSPASSTPDTVVSFQQKYESCLSRCKYLIKHDLFLFEEGLLLSGGKNDGVGGGDNGGNGPSGGSGQVQEATLKSAAIIDYQSGVAIVSAAAHQQNGAAGSGAEGRSNAARQAERKELELQYLHNVLFLLSVSDSCFDSLKSSLSRHWNVLDIARSRRDYEATSSGQRVLAGLYGTQQVTTNTSASSAAAASSSPAPNVILAESFAPKQPKEGETEPVHSVATTPPFGAFAAPSFCVTLMTLKESVASEKLAEIVRDTLTRPFIAAYGKILEHQRETLQTGCDGKAATAFATKRVAEMLSQVFTHELGLTETLLKDL